MDVSPEQVVQKENLIVAPKYDGKLEDVYLLDMLSFFRRTPLSSLLSLSLSSSASSRVHKYHTTRHHRLAHTVMYVRACAAVLAATGKSSGTPDVRTWVGAINNRGLQYFKKMHAEVVRKAKERAEQEKKLRDEQAQMRDVASTGRKW
jgi:hypothetical protein